MVRPSQRRPDRSDDHWRKDTRLDTSTEPRTAGPANFAVDRHDAVWFTEVQSGLVGYIANTTPLSVSHEYAVTGNGSLLIDIIIGPDGNPWFTVQARGPDRKDHPPLKAGTGY